MPCNPASALPLRARTSLSSFLLPHTPDALLSCHRPLICTTGAKFSSMPRCKGIGMPKPKKKRVEQAEEHTIEEIEDD